MAAETAFCACSIDTLARRCFSAASFTACASLPAGFTGRFGAAFFGKVVFGTGVFATEISFPQVLKRYFCLGFAFVAGAFFGEGFGLAAGLTPGDVISLYVSFSSSIRVFN